MYIKDNGKGGYDLASGIPEMSGIMDTGWIQVADNDTRLAKVGYADKTYIEKRQMTLAGGGYGSWQEQLEMINEKGVAVWQAHCTTVKNNIPK